MLIYRPAHPRRDCPPVGRSLPCQGGKVRDHHLWRDLGHFIVFAIPAEKSSAPVQDVVPVVPAQFFRYQGLIASIQTFFRRSSLLDRIGILQHTRPDLGQRSRPGFSQLRVQVFPCLYQTAGFLRALGIAKVLCCGLGYKLLSLPLPLPVFLLNTQRYLPRAVFELVWNHYPFLSCLRCHDF